MALNDLKNYVLGRAECEYDLPLKRQSHGTSLAWGTHAENDPNVAGSVVTDTIEYSLRMKKGSGSVRATKRF